MLGDGFIGDVAIDDIILSAGSCAVIPEDAKTNANYTKPTKEPPAVSTTRPGLNNCEFEDDLCSWSSIKDEVQS